MGIFTELGVLYAKYRPVRGRGKGTNALLHAMQGVVLAAHGGVAVVWAASMAALPQLPPTLIAPAPFTPTTQPPRRSG